MHPPQAGCLEVKMGHAEMMSVADVVSLRDALSDLSVVVFFPSFCHLPRAVASFIFLQEKEDHPYLVGLNVNLAPLGEGFDYVA